MGQGVRQYLCRRCAVDSEELRHTPCVDVVLVIAGGRARIVHNQVNSAEPIQCCFDDLLRSLRFGEGCLCVFGFWQLLL